MSVHRLFFALTVFVLCSVPAIVSSRPLILKTEDSIHFTEEVTEANYHYPIFTGGTTIVLDFSGAPAARVVNFNYPLVENLPSNVCSFTLTGTLRNTVLRFSHVTMPTNFYLRISRLVSVDAHFYNSSLLISNSEAWYTVLQATSSPIIAENSFIGFNQVGVSYSLMQGNFNITNSIINITDIKDTALPLSLTGQLHHSTILLNNVTSRNNIMSLYVVPNVSMTSNTFYIENVRCSIASNYVNSYITISGLPQYYMNNSFYLKNCSGGDYVLSSQYGTSFLVNNTLRGDQYTTCTNVALTTQGLWEKYVGGGVGAMLSGCDDLCLGGTFTNCKCVCSSGAEKGAYCISNRYYDEVYVVDTITRTALPSEE